MPSQPTRELKTVPNQYRNREYTVTIDSPEFTCLCPMTGQPDFADIRITYVPRERLIELKALKLYLWSYRDEGVFHETVVNQILDDIVAAADPLRIEVVGDFRVRGGLHTVVTATHARPADAADVAEPALVANHR